MVDVTFSPSLKLISKPLLPIIFAKDEPPGPLLYMSYASLGVNELLKNLNFDV